MLKLLINLVAVAPTLIVGNSAVRNIADYVQKEANGIKLTSGYFDTFKVFSDINFTKDTLTSLGQINWQRSSISRNAGNIKDVYVDFKVSEIVEYEGQQEIYCTRNNNLIAYDGDILTFTIVNYESENAYFSRVWNSAVMCKPQYLFYLNDYQDVYYGIVKNNTRNLDISTNFDEYNSNSSFGTISSGTYKTHTLGAGNTYDWYNVPIDCSSDTSEYLISLIEWKSKTSGQSYRKENGNICDKAVLEQINRGLRLTQFNRYWGADDYFKIETKLTDGYHLNIDTFGALFETAIPTKFDGVGISTGALNRKFIDIQNGSIANLNNMWFNGLDYESSADNSKVKVVAPYPSDPLACINEKVESNKSYLMKSPLQMTNIDRVGFQFDSFPCGLEEPFEIGFVPYSTTMEFREINWFADSDIFIYDTPKDADYVMESCSTLDVFCYMRNATKWVLYEFAPVKYARSIFMSWGTLFVSIMTLIDSTLIVFSWLPVPLMLFKIAFWYNFIYAFVGFITFGFIGKKKGG